MPGLIIRLSGIKWFVFSLVFISLGKKSKEQHWFSGNMYSVSSIEDDRKQWKEQYTEYAVGKS